MGFISTDPMGFGAGDTNLYRYVGNNATNATDPTGKLAWFVIPAVIAVAGAAFGAYSNYEYQQSRIADLKQIDVDYVDVVSSAAWGAVGATAGYALATLSPHTLPFMTGAGLVSAALNTQNALTASAAKEYSTAEYYRNMAYFDLFGSLSTFHTPNPPSMQSAMALATSGVNALSGALVGSGIGDIFQHYFGMSNQNAGSGQDNGTGSGAGNSRNQELDTFLDNNIKTEDIPTLQSMMENDKTIKSLGDAQLILDANKIHDTWPVGKQQNQKTVATGVFFDPENDTFKKVYAISSNKTSRDSRLKAAELGYDRIYGKEYVQKDPKQTHAEQILINYAEKKGLLQTDVDAPIAPTRPACGATAQDCSGRIESTAGVRLIGAQK